MEVRQQLNQPVSNEESLPIVNLYQRLEGIEINEIEIDDEQSQTGTNMHDRTNDFTPPTRDW